MQFHKRPGFPAVKYFYLSVFFSIAIDRFILLEYNNCV